MALPQMQHAADAKHCRSCGHAYVYEAIYLGHLGRYRCPQCGRRRRARRRRRAGAPERRARRRVHAADPWRAGRSARDGRAPPPRPLQRLQRARRRRAGDALGVPLEQIVAGLGAVEAAFGRAETIELDGRHLSILLIKNPAGANEVLRTLALEPGPLDLLAVLNDNIADGRDVSWVWDADFELLAGRVAPRHLRRHARGRAGRAAEVRRRRARAPRRRAGAGGRARRGSTRHGERPLYALPTYTAMLALRELLARAAPRRSTGDERARGPRPTELRVLWHDLECGRYARTCRCGASWPAERRRPGPRPRRRQRARRARPRARPATTVVGARRRPRRCSPRSQRAAAAGLAVETVAADARDFALGAASRSCSCRCRRSSCSAAPTAGPALLRSAAAHLRAGRPARVRARRRARGLRRRAAPSRRCPTCSSATAGSTRSHPVAVRADADGATIERIRQTVAPDGAPHGRAATSCGSTGSTASTLEAEGVTAGLRGRRRGASSR